MTSLITTQVTKNVGFIFVTVSLNLADVHSQNGIKKERKTIIHKIGKKRSVKFGQLKRNNEIDSDADNLSKNTR